MGKLGAWRADVRAALCDRLDRRECMGAGRGCMLGDFAAINTTNSSHKIICKNLNIQYVLARDKLDVAMI